MPDKLFIVHPGTQHAYRLANALCKSDKFSKVYLFTWLTLPDYVVYSKLKAFKKRVKSIHPGVSVYNFPFFEALMVIQKKIQSFFGTPNYNTYYFWYTLFNLFMLPIVYLNRREIVLVLFETAGWPLSKFAKKWGITVIMDFPSISHEAAIEMGIKETGFGIRIKEKERKNIDYALFCSDFARKTYEGRTSSRKDFVLHVGAELKSICEVYVKDCDKVLRLASICNMEYRKGLDILLMAFSNLNIPKELHLIGKINKQWVKKFSSDNGIDETGIFFTGALSQQNLNEYLLEKKIDLHVLASRFDSFGMVVPETMMLGIPNILSPFVGAGELIENDKDGFILEQLNSESLTTQINRFCSLPAASRAQLKKDVINKAHQMSWENYYEKVIQMIEEVFDEKGKGEKKIAFIVTHPTQFEVPFYKYLNRTGKDNLFHVFYLDEPGDHYDTELKQKINWGLNMYEGYSFTVLKQRTKFQQLGQILEERHFDIVILNGYKGAYLGLKEFVKSKGIAVGLRIDSVLFNQSSFKNLLRKLFLSRIYRSFDLLFATGKLSKEYLKVMNVNEKRTSFFYYCTDNSYFKCKSKDKIKREELKRTWKINDEKVILIVAKFNKRESPWDALKAFVKLNRNDLVLVIAGDGEEREQLESYALKFPDLKITFPGYISYSELPYYYGISEIFIHSAQNEPWGVSVQEALASGCAVIASDRVGAAFDLIRDSKNGFIYKYANIQLLADYILKCLAFNKELLNSTTNEVLLKWNYEVMWEEISKGANALNKVTSYHRFHV